MPKFPKPFFRTGRGWYVQLGKEQIKLANGPQNADTEAQAFTRYYAIMAERGRPKPAAPQTDTATMKVVEIFEKHFDWCQKHRAARTYGWYHDHLQDFLNHLGAAARMVVTDLKPFHVIEWADSHTDWSPAYRKGGIVAIQRPFNWAEELGYIAASPIKKIKKPQPQRRESHATTEDFALLLDRFPEGDPFRDLILFSWHSGCRPQEARLIEARHVQLAADCILIPKEEA